MVQSKRQRLQHEAQIKRQRLQLRDDQPQVKVQRRARREPRPVVIHSFSTRDGETATAFKNLTPVRDSHKDNSGNGGK